MGEMATRLLTLCNSFVPPELRDVCLMCVKEMLMLWPNEMLTILVSKYVVKLFFPIQKDNTNKQ